MGAFFLLQITLLHVLPHARSIAADGFEFGPTHFVGTARLPVPLYGDHALGQRWQFLSTLRALIILPLSILCQVGERVSILRHAGCDLSTLRLIVLGFRHGRLSVLLILSTWGVSALRRSGVCLSTLQLIW